MLFILNETFTNGFNFGLLDAIWLGSIICGVFVIISKNPILSVLFLIGLFLNIAGYLMMLGINFIGLSYLLVYVGAVSILFLFILMLINVRISELVTDNNNSIPLAIIIGVVLYLTLYKLLYPTQGLYSLVFNIMFNQSTNTDVNYALNNILINYAPNNMLHLSFISSQVWDGILSETSHITTIGNIIYTVYPLWLILTSIILLLAMIGAIVITIKK